jgi:hypothetical protein
MKLRNVACSADLSQSAYLVEPVQPRAQRVQVREDLVRHRFRHEDLTSVPA